MEKTKKTKRDYFEELKIAIVGNENENELIEFINKQIELLDKKKSGNSKKALETNQIMEDVFNALVELGKPSTATQIAEKLGVSNQKVSAYLRKLVDSNRVEKTPEKRVSYFSAIVK